MRSEIEEVELQGIEFWSNVCDEEVDLAIEASEAAEMGRPPEHTSKFYAKGALQYLVPVLMQTLTKQEEYDDDDDWNPCKAAGVCLMLLANCCEDVIVPHVLPFVKTNIEVRETASLPPYLSSSLTSFFAFRIPTGGSGTRLSWLSVRFWRVPIRPTLSPSSSKPCHSSLS